MSRELVRFWKGSEGSYRELYIRGRIKDNVKYTVICDDGTVKEYLGNVPLGSCELEQMPFVDDVIGASTVVGEIAALDTQVKTNADAIATETTRAEKAEAKALADANAYTDKALEWIDAGTYGTEA